jgi:hypothetical protein
VSSKARQVASSMVKSSRAANLTARSMRTGSSWKRSSGSPIVRMTPRSRSARPSTKSTIASASVS